MLLLRFLLLFILFCACVSKTREEEDEYIGNCKIGGAIEVCHVAMFSKFTYAFAGEYVYLNTDLCDPNERLVDKRLMNSIVGVRRGNCSFDSKATNAQLHKFIGLVILNNEEAIPATFPMGSSNSDYTSSIPVVMMIAKDRLIQPTASTVELSFVNKENLVKAQRSEIMSSNVYLTNSIVVALGIILIGSCIVVFVQSVRELAGKDNQLPNSIEVEAYSHQGTYDVIVKLTCIFTITLLFVLLRLSTFRMQPALSNESSPSGSSVIEINNRHYNHRETDELIFQKLTEYVSRNWLDYTLKDKDIMQQYNLAPENYSDAIFIHPPLFVYLSTFLLYMCKLSLPAIPVLYQLVTLLLIPAITLYIDPTLNYATGRSSCGYIVNHTSLGAMIVLLCCPLCMFCSQKFWIDNCLIMCVTICVAGHLRLIDGRGISSLKDKPLNANMHGRCFLSGFIFFGGIAMYCKITAIALLPFLICWIILQRFIVITHLYKDSSSMEWRLLLLDCQSHIGVFLFGFILAYAPWTILYLTYTGRWVPNAWPSETMLKNSSFVRAAVNKPFYYYLQVLLTFSPCHVIGIIFAAVLVISIARHLWYNKKSIKLNEISNSPSAISMAHIIVFSLWPASFLVGLTLLGLRGSGYQSRFLLPLLPATAILCSIAVNSVSSNFKSGALLVSLMFALCIIYSVIHSLYYGTLYAPVFAELEFSLVDIVKGILTNPYVPPGSRESYDETVKFMAHFGLNRR